MFKYKVEEVKKSMLKGIEKLDEKLENREYAHRITNCYIWNRPDEILFDGINDIVLIDLNKYLIAPLECVDKKSFDKINKNCKRQHGIKIDRKNSYLNKFIRKIFNRVKL